MYLPLIQNIYDTHIMEECIKRIKFGIESNENVLICGAPGSGKGHLSKLSLKNRSFKFITYGDLLMADFDNFYESPRQKFKRLMEEALIEDEIVILGNLEEFLQEPALWFTLTTGGWFQRFKTNKLPVICTINSEETIKVNTVKDHFLHLISVPKDGSNIRFADLKAARRESEPLRVDESKILEKMVQEGRTCEQLSNRNGSMLLDFTNSNNNTSTSSSNTDNGADNDNDIEDSLKLESVFGVSQDIKKVLLESANFTENNLKRGALLYGPPGTGKTRLALALAGTLGKATRFISVSSADLLRSEIGTSEIKLREIFKLARASEPSIIFFDEIDALFPQNPPMTLLSLQHQLIAEFDSIQLHQHLTGKLVKVFVLGATNFLEKVESRILTAGRFELRIEIGLPSFEERFDIFRNELANESEITVELLEKLARKTGNKSPADLIQIIQEARKNSWIRSDKHASLKQIDFSILFK